MKKYLLTIEVADLLRLSPRTLERWRYQRIGPQYRRAGGRVIYAAEDVEAFQQAGLVETGK